MAARHLHTAGGIITFAASALGCSQLLYECTTTTTTTTTKVGLMCRGVVTHLKPACNRCCEQMLPASQFASVQAIFVSRRSMLMNFTADLARSSIEYSKTPVVL
jgi:hypothetical protein